MEGLVSSLGFQLDHLIHQGIKRFDLQEDLPFAWPYYIRWEKDFPCAGNPMKALILAAGLGTRLRPVTNFIPKPLMPVFGISILERNVLQLRDQGVRELWINLHHMPRQIVQRLRNGEHLGVEIRYSLEPTILGTAGGIKKLESELRGEPFLVVNGDTFRHLDLEGLWNAHRRMGHPLTMLVQNNPQLEPHRSVSVGPRGEVLAFLDMYGEHTQDGAVRCDFLGVQVVEPEVLCMIPPDRPWELQRLYVRLLESGRGVGAHCDGGYWKDLGTLSAYREIHLDGLEGRGPVHIPGRQVKPGVWMGEGASLGRRVHLEPPLFLGPESRVDSGARVGPYAVLGAKCSVGSGARVERSILWDEVEVGPGIQVVQELMGRSFRHPLPWP